MTQVHGSTGGDAYEAPVLSDLGTIEELTRQDPIIDISIVIG